MDKDFLDKMKDNLISQRKVLQLKVVENKNLDVDVDGDEFDEIQGNLLIEMHNQLSVRDNDKLNKIENALHQIEKNTYGMCEDCGDSIPEKRLLINPYVLTCVSCAEDRELEEKQRRREQN